MYRNIDCKHYCRNIFRGTIKDSRFGGDIVFSFAAHYQVTILTLGLFGHSLQTHFHFTSCVVFSSCLSQFPFQHTITCHSTDTHDGINIHSSTALGAPLTSALGPRQRDGQTDRKRESGRVHLRTNGELGQSAAQPLRDCLQLFQLRLLTPALLAQDLVLQPLVTLSKTQHTCSERRALLTQRLRHQGPLSNKRLCLRPSTSRPGKHRDSCATKALGVLLFLQS